MGQKATGSMQLCAPNPGAETSLFSGVTPLKGAAAGSRRGCKGVDLGASGMQVQNQAQQGPMVAWGSSLPLSQSRFLGLGASKETMCELFRMIRGTQLCCGSSLRLLLLGLIRGFDMSWSVRQLSQHQC